MQDTGIHLAIIPDGNRRWAKARQLLPWNGHEKAVDNFRTITDWCLADPRVSTLTVWCFSTENWKREPEEISRLMQLLEDYLQREAAVFQEKNIRFVHSGRRDRIPASLRDMIDAVAADTGKNTAFTLQLAVDYGGRDELTRAIQKLQQKQITDITDEAIRSHLDHPELPDLDLIIRTSGEQRTSNFFLWQSTYAEWVFLNKLFPDFSPRDIDQALIDFNKRTRRFGS